MADRVPDVLVRYHDLARKACHDIASACDYFQSLARRTYRRNGDFYLFGGFLSDVKFEFIARMAHDICIKAISRNPRIPRIHDAAKRNDADIRCSSTDIDDHVSPRLVNRQFYANRRRKRFLNNMHFASTGRARSITNRTNLDRRDPRWHTDTHPRTQKFRMPFLGLAYQIRKHFRSDLEIRNDAVHNWLHRTNMRRGPTQHVFCLLSHCDHLSRFLIHRDDRRFIDDDAAVFYIDECVRRAEIYADVV